MSGVLLIWSERILRQLLDGVEPMDAVAFVLTGCAVLVWSVGIAYRPITAALRREVPELLREP